MLSAAGFRGTPSLEMSLIADIFYMQLYGIVQIIL